MLTISARARARAGEGRRPGEGRHPDAGTSVIEVVVAMGIMSLLMAGFMAIVIMMSRATATAGAVGAASTQLRSVVDTLGRQASYASAVNPPTVVGTDVYLELGSDAVAAGKPSTCVQWVYRSASGVVQSRSWNTLTVSPTAWQTVVRSVGNDLTGRPPFVVRVADGVHARPVVTIDLIVKPPGQPSSASTSAFALRNYQGASPGAVCTEVARS